MLELMAYPIKKEEKKCRFSDCRYSTIKMETIFDKRVYNTYSYEGHHYNAIGYIHSADLFEGSSTIAAKTRPLDAINVPCEKTGVNIEGKDLLELF